MALSITELATGRLLGSQINSKSAYRAEAGLLLNWLSQLIVSQLTEQQQVCSLALSVNSKSAYRAAAGQLLGSLR